MVVTGQEIVRGKKFFKVREKSGNFTSSQGKVTSLKEVREKWNFKSTLLLFSLYFCCFQTFYGHELCCIGKILFMKLYDRLMFPFQEHHCFFARYVNELLIHVHCTWLAESISKWVEWMAVRGGFSPSSGLVCEIVNSIRENSGNFRNLYLWQLWFIVLGYREW